MILQMSFIQFLELCSLNPLWNKEKPLEVYQLVNMIKSYDVIFQEREK